MHFSNLVTALAAVAAAPALAAPAPAPMASFANEHLVTPETHVKDRFIVVFKDGVSPQQRSAHLNSVGATVRQNNARIGARDGSSARTYQGIRKTLNVFSFSGYSGEFDQATLNEIRKKPEVEFVQQDSIMKANEVQKDADWGLARMSATAPAGNSTSLHRRQDQGPVPPKGEYMYNAEWAGQGVTVYVIDTGINIKHQDFEGRAKWGFNAINGSKDDDENGHGSHCAGTIGGKTYGVAKKANLVAVKVLDAEGSGSTEGVVAGIDWVAANAQKPAVVSMSLGGPADDALDKAMLNLYKNDIVPVVAAGNEDADADTSSPARVKEIITVAALGPGDKRADFSNYGKLVDIFAPGVNIESAWMGNDTATNVISGTSMACPHISGLAAYFLSMDKGGSGLFKRQNGTGQATDKVLDVMSKFGQKDKVQDPKGSPNLLAYNGAEDGKPAGDSLEAILARL